MFYKCKVKKRWKNGSLAFAEAWAFACWGKSQCAIVRWQKMNKKCAVGKRENTEVSAKVSDYPLSRFNMVCLCLSVCQNGFIFCLSVRYCQVARSSVTLGANVLRLGGGGDLNHKCLYEAHFKFTKTLMEKHETATFAKPAVIGWRSCLSWVTNHFMSSVAVICRLFLSGLCVSGFILFEALGIFKTILSFGFASSIKNFGRVSACVVLIVLAKCVGFNNSKSVQLQSPYRYRSVF